MDCPECKCGPMHYEPTLLQMRCLHCESTFTNLQLASIEQERLQSGREKLQLYGGSRSGGKTTMIRAASNPSGRHNLGETVAAAWEEYVGADPMDNIFGSSWLAERLEEPEHIEIEEPAPLQLMPGVIITDSQKALGQTMREIYNKCSAETDGHVDGLRYAFASKPVYDEFERLGRIANIQRTEHSFWRRGAGSTTFHAIDELDTLDTTRIDIFDKGYESKLVEVPRVGVGGRLRLAAFNMLESGSERAQLMESLKIKVDS